MPAHASRKLFPSSTKRPKWPPSNSCHPEVYPCLGLEIQGNRSEHWSRHSHRSHEAWLLAAVAVGYCRIEGTAPLWTEILVKTAYRMRIKMDGGLGGLITMGPPRVDSVCHNLEYALWSAAITASCSIRTVSMIGFSSTWDCSAARLSWTNDAAESDAN